MRIYPLRMSKNYWKIPIYSKHQCNEFCKLSLFSDQNNSNYLSISQNSDYDISSNKCPKNNKIQRDIIPISNYDINIPQTRRGILCNFDQIVIPHKNFKTYITYPLTNPVDIEIVSSTENFTLRELIYSIKEAYTEIYKEEEKTATPLIYERKKICSCKYIDLKKTLKKHDKIENQKCVICYDDLCNCKNVKLNCEHIFHKKCIEKWVDTKGDNCPLCRTSLYKCSICKGKKYISSYYKGIVIPIKERGYIMNRNYTNGIYGIYGHDLEDLCIKEMYYNKLRRRLYLDIVS
jgi:hypothetical protein